MSDDINVNSVTAKTVTTENLTVNKSATIGKVTINADDKGTIGGLTNKTWDAKKITSGQAATEDQLQAATKNAVNYDSDSSKTITLRENTTIKNVANTSIEQGSKNAVNAGTIYNETRVKQDGKYVKVSNTAGENLSALDNQVASNSSNITNLNGRVNNLNSKVNKVGAGAAALAALHPLDFDPEDKWDFAVGYGNYRDANSVAVGAFYRPDDDTMFSVGTNFGNGENMINANAGPARGRTASPRPRVDHPPLKDPDYLEHPGTSRPCTGSRKSTDNHLRIVCAFCCIKGSPLSICCCRLPHCSPKAPFSAMASWSAHEVPRPRQSLPWRRAAVLWGSAPSSSLPMAERLPEQPPTKCTSWSLPSSPMAKVIRLAQTPCGVNE